MGNVNRTAGIAVMLLAAIACVCVASGFFQPPQPDEGTAAHIFQLSIVALVPAALLFLVTADWREPMRSLRPMIAPAAAVTCAFCALFYLEHLR